MSTGSAARSEIQRIKNEYGISLSGSAARQLTTEPPNH